MLLPILLGTPLLGISIILSNLSIGSLQKMLNSININTENNKLSKIVALTVSIINLIISLFIFILFDFSTNQFQFVQEHYKLAYFDVYLGLDGLSIYFVLLTTIIMPISLLSN